MPKCHFWQLPLIGGGTGGPRGPLAADVMFSASLLPEGRDGDAVEIAPDGDPKRGVVLTGYRFEKKKELHQSAVQLTILARPCRRPPDGPGSFFFVQ